MDPMFSLQGRRINHREATQGEAQTDNVLQEGIGLVMHSHIFLVVAYHRPASVRGYDLRPQEMSLGESGFSRSRSPAQQHQTPGR
jgi:hypothetical protein